MIKTLWRMQCTCSWRQWGYERWRATSYVWLREAGCPHLSFHTSKRPRSLWCHIGGLSRKSQPWKDDGDVLNIIAVLDRSCMTIMPGVVKQIFQHYIAFLSGVGRRKLWKRDDMSSTTGLWCIGICMERISTTGSLVKAHYWGSSRTFRCMLYESQKIWGIEYGIAITCHKHQLHAIFCWT